MEILYLLTCHMMHRLGTQAALTFWRLEKFGVFEGGSCGLKQRYLGPAVGLHLWAPNPSCLLFPLVHPFWNFTLLSANSSSNQSALPKPLLCEQLLLCVCMVWIL
jgi:hypothetical protein